MSLPLEDYALISNCHSAALVGKNGSIDWLCFPCFDSAACFASLLGTKDHGNWRIAPREEYEITRKYFEDTMVLETIFTTTSGKIKLVDCMLMECSGPTLVRTLKGLDGSVELDFELTIRFDYGSIIPWVRKIPEGYGINAVAGPEAIIIYSPVELHGKNMHTAANFNIEKGEK